MDEHMIFYIKMGGKFTMKAILLSDFHTTAPTSSITYSSVLSRNSVRISFLLASLNGLEIFSWDIGNKCLDANCRERFGHNWAHILVMER